MLAPARRLRESQRPWIRRTFDSCGTLETPLLIGPTVTLAKEAPAPPASTPVSMTMVASVMVVIAAAGVGLVLLTWYYHRGDQKMNSSARGEQ